MSELVRIAANVMVGGLAGLIALATAAVFLFTIDLALPFFAVLFLIIFGIALIVSLAIKLHDKLYRLTNRSLPNVFEDLRDDL